MDQLFGLLFASGLILLGVAIGCTITFVLFAWQLTKITESITSIISRVSDLIESVDDRLLADFMEMDDDDDEDGSYKWN